MSQDAKTLEPIAGASAEPCKPSCISGMNMFRKDTLTLSQSPAPDRVRGNESKKLCSSCKKNPVTELEKKFNLPSGARLIVENICLLCVDEFEEKVKCLEKAAWT